MSEALKDHPDVVVFPPLVPIAILALSIALRQPAPLHLLAAIEPTPRIIAGAIVAAFGILLTVNGGQARRVPPRNEPVAADAGAGD